MGTLVNTSGHRFATATVGDQPASGVNARVGVQTVNGAIWTFLFSILHKVVLGVSQIALAWFVTPADFGLAALAVSATSFSWLIGGANLKTLLVQQSANFKSLAGQVFWVSLAINATAAIVLVMLAPLAGSHTGQSGLPPLIFIAALATLVQAFPTVYSAVLSRDLRFRHLAAINFGAGVSQYAVAITLAALGFGPYALVVPLVMVGTFLAVASRLASGPVPLGRPAPGTWPGLLKPASWLMANAACLSAQTYGANIIIGLMHGDPAVTGYYFWGAAIPAHVGHLMAANFQGVLFPALHKLNDDPERQARAARQSCSMLGLVMAPVCVLLMLNARTMIGLVFHERWLPSATVVEWLSIGAMGQPLVLVAGSLLMARGRFRLLAGLSFLSAVIVLGATAMGARTGDQGTIASYSGVAMLVVSAISGALAFAAVGAGARSALMSLIPYLLVGAAAALSGSWVAGRVVTLPLVLRLTVPSLCAMAVYLAGSLLFFRAQLKELLGRIRRRQAHSAPSSDQTISTDSSEILSA